MLDTVLNRSIDLTNCSVSGDCTSKCRNNLMKAKESYGCCANTHFYRKLYDRPLNFDQYYSCKEQRDIWNHCGVTSPGFCKNKLIDSGTFDKKNSDCSFFVNSKLYVVFPTIIFAYICV